MVCIFSLYYKTLKKGRWEIKERKRTKRESLFPPIICGFISGIAACPCAKGEDSCINRIADSWTTNSSEACGLGTHSYTGHTQSSSFRAAAHVEKQANRSHRTWPQFGNANYKVCTCGETAQIGSRWVRGACKMYESQEAESAFLNEEMKKHTPKKGIELQFIAHFFVFMGHFLQTTV